MAIRLGLNQGPRWVSVGATGARLLLRYATSIEHGAAEATAQKRLRAAIEGKDALADLGMSSPDANLLDDPIYLVGFARYLSACALGVRVISDWEGITDELGNKIAVTPESVAHLMLNETARHTLEREAYGLLVVADAEGKGSAPSQTGSAAGARSTAGAARRRASPARKAAKAKTANTAH